MAPPTKLIEVIGIPGIITGINANYDQELAYLAKINKVELLYALRTNSIGVSDLIKQYQNTVRIVKDISELFNAGGVNYAIFKTIKPFEFTPSDIDVLVSDQDCKRAMIVLQGAGYGAIQKDMFCVSMRKEMTVDLYLEPSVSNIAYLKTEELMEDLTFKNIDGVRVNTLSAQGEFIAVISHSLFKEQMITLNDYYTLAALAQQTALNRIIEMAQNTNTIPVLKLIAGVCSAITEEVFGESLNLNVCKIAKELDASLAKIENLPYKFPMNSVIRLLLEKRIFKDSHDRAKLFKGLAYSLSFNQARKFFQHMHRETY